MQCWDILEISATQDKRAIKSAYAKKLKVTRPDEEPQKFQELNQAYKHALSIANESAREYAEQPLIEVEEIGINAVQTENEEIEEQLSPEEMARNQLLTDEFERLKLKAEDILNDDIARNSRSSWQFLLRSECILEHDFNVHFGLYLLDAIYKHNKEHTVKKKVRGKVYTDKKAIVKDETICHLDSVFNWRSQLNQVYYYLGEDIANFVMKLDNIAARVDIGNAAISSVKGGSVTSKAVKEKNELEDFYAASEALGNAIRLFLIMTVLVGAATALTLYEGIQDGEFGPVIIMGCFFGFLLSLLIGLKKQYKFAHRLAWIIVVPMMFGVPVGTIWGGIIAINLYRSHSLSSLK